MRQRVGSWVWRCAVAAAVVAGLMGTATGTAAAVPEYAWRDGHFRAAGTPVYPESPDGWRCHLAGSCRDSEEREPGDPEPAWYSDEAGDAVKIECVLGKYYKIHQDDREGWAPASTVAAHLKPVGCYAGDF